MLRARCADHCRQKTPYHDSRLGSGVSSLLDVYSCSADPVVAKSREWRQRSGLPKRAVEPTPLAALFVLGRLGGAKAVQPRKIQVSAIPPAGNSPGQVNRLWKSGRFGFSPYAVQKCRPFGTAGRSWFGRSCSPLVASSKRRLTSCRLVPRCPTVPRDVIITRS